MGQYMRQHAKALPVVTAVRVLLAVAMLAGLAGCGAQVERRIERGIEQELPTVIGPARSYSVDVTGPSSQLARGQLDTLRIVGEDVHLPTGLQLARLEVFARDVRFDPNRQVLTSVGLTEFTAIMTQEQLNQYLRRTYPDVPELRAELQNGFIRISAAPGVAGARVGITADAGLQIRNQRQVMVDIRRITVAGVAAPGFARDYIENRVNPVFDAADLGYDARIRTLSVRPNALTMYGTLDLMTVYAAQQRRP